MEASMTTQQHLAAVESADLASVLDGLGARMRFGRDEEIYAQDDEVTRLFRVVRGVVRTSRFTVEGRRQIGDFYYAGDVFGLEPGPLHLFAAEALTDCEVVAVKRTVVEQAVGAAAFNAAVLQATRRELARLQEHVLVLGRKAAVSRVASFLLGVAGRTPGEDAELAMGRQDMADYLGLTIETVSRSLSQLQGEAVVAFPSSRRFQVRKWEVLEDLVA
jgi:CRP/FNR family nitrogen fixation transcriptional regulator